MTIRSRENTASHDPTTQYARDVVAGKILQGPYIRAACARHLRDLKDGRKRGLRFNRVAAQKALDFFPDLLKVEKGGKVVPFRLLGWQTFVVGSLFGWQKWTEAEELEEDEADDEPIPAGWYRRYREAYIESGKGSGKSPLLAGIGLYMMLVDGILEADKLIKELSAEVYAAAAKLDQARVLFRDAVSMVDRSPRIRRNVKQTGKNPVIQLTHIPSASFFKPLGSDKTKSGPRVFCALVDELHEHKERYTIDMLKAGFKGRRQPMLVTATNSGFDRQSICFEKHEHAIAIVEQLREDDGFFAFVFALDEGDDPLEDEACWPKTNPGIGTTITREYLRSQVSEARQIPGRESNVRRLNFCEWTDSEATWMTRNLWVANEEQLGDAAEGMVLAPAFEGAECFVSLDLAFVFDLAAMAVVFPEGDNLCGWIEYFTPKDSAVEREKRDRVPYQRWIRDGLVHGTEGKVVRTEHVGRRLGQILSTFDVQFVSYDRYRHKELADDMEALGINAPWIEHPQGFRRGGMLPFPQFRSPKGEKVENPLWMPDSVQKLEGRLLERRMRIQPSPVTHWQVSSTVIRNDPAGTGNRVFDKARAVGRIDGIVAIAMAAGTADMRIDLQDLSGFLAQPIRGL
jgi:phage terminase large subunit-like protein